MASLIHDLVRAIRRGRTFGSSAIYEVSDDVLAKVGSGTRLRDEMETAQVLRRHGVAVPRMYGVFLPDEEMHCLMPFGSRMAHCLLMERIRGRSLLDLSGRVYERARRMYRRQVARVLDIGFLPIDGTSDGNGILEDGTGRIVLVDFELWTRNPASETVCAFRERNGF